MADQAQDLVAGGDVLSADEYQGLFFGLSPDLICVVANDGRIKMANPAFCASTGLEGGAAAGKTLFDLIHPEDLGRTRAKFTRVIEKGKVAEFEARLAARDGHVVWLRWRGVHLPAKGLVCLFGRDVSIRHKIENQLEESEDRYRYFVEQTGEGIYRLESKEPIPLDLPEDEMVRTLYDNLYVAECNDVYAGMYGAARAEEMIGLTKVELHGGYEVEENVRAMRTFIRDGFKVVDLETVEVARDGAKVYLANNAVGVVKDGFLTGIWGTQRNISGRRRAQVEREETAERDRRAQKLESLGVLAGSIAHNFNNILMGAMGFLDSALEVVPADVDGRDLIEKAKAQARRAAELSSLMLVYVGQGQETIFAVSLNTMVEDLAPNLTASAGKAAELRLELCEEATTIMADPSQVRQAILNLVANAAEAYGDAPGEVTLSTNRLVCDEEFLKNTYHYEDQPPGTYVVFEVADRGRGMDEETLQKAFDPFYTTRFTGRGLGLAAVLGIVRAHKGAIQVVTAVGKGTWIRLLFPATNVSPYPQRAARDVAKVSPGAGLILLVDDEEAVLDAVGFLLEIMGFSVVTAQDGESAIALFQERSKNLKCVILDLVMPGMDGKEVYNRLREIDPDVPVIISSGYSEKQIETHFMGKEIAKVIQKPYSLGQLREAVTAAIKR